MTFAETLTEKERRRGRIMAYASSWFGCAVYAVQRPLYSATWYPMLDNFLRPEDRGDFFGTMQLISTVGIAGSVAGFFFFGKLLRSSSYKVMELGTHTTMMIQAFVLFFYRVNLPYFLYVVCAVVFIQMFCQSCYLCCKVLSWK